MGKYHDTRSEIQGLVKDQLSWNVQQEGQIPGVAVNIMLAEKSEKILEEFEALVIAHHEGSFWRGVRQSFYGSMLFAFFIASIYVVVLGSELGFRDVMEALLKGQNPSHVEPRVPHNAP